MIENRKTQCKFLDKINPLSQNKSKKNYYRNKINNLFNNLKTRFRICKTNMISKSKNFSHN